MANDTTETTGATTETAEAEVKRLEAEAIAGFDLAAAIAALPDGIKAAITEGHIVAAASTVTITRKASPTGKAAVRAYVQRFAQGGRGMAALCGGKMEPATDKPATGDDARTEEQKASGAADYFNYGYDLEVRARERAALTTTLEGPEKAIKKAVDNCVTNLGMTEADARTFVIAQRTKAGLPV